MFIVGLLEWWYGAGWRQRVVLLRDGLTSTMDFFSIDLLAHTLFSPFRQISAGTVRGPIGAQLQAWFDRLISRLIGAIIRSFMIVFGICTIVLRAIFGGAMVICWGVIPLLPVVGIMLLVARWLPWQ